MINTRTHFSADLTPTIRIFMSQYIWLTKVDWEIKNKKKLVGFNENNWHVGFCYHTFSHAIYFKKSPFDCLLLIYFSPKQILHQFLDILVNIESIGCIRHAEIVNYVSIYDPIIYFSKNKNKNESYEYSVSSMKSRTLVSSNLLLYYTLKLFIVFCWIRV